MVVPAAGAVYTGATELSAAAVVATTGVVTAAAVVATTGVVATTLEVAWKLRSARMFRDLLLFSS